ncbi:MAG: lipid-A-disaccharide synthase N-terminal domain-containing protein [Candidatus Hydrogenedentes bacterium]|nr:lipid-A-disaccharide synthase N-terminal domain-containing protein [Candidatus Hydrogenedentota bacterium]
MTPQDGWTAAMAIWWVFGTVGAIIFYGRFYVQWLASERRKQSVMPVAFWYMSACGSVMQFIYAVHLNSPGAAFGLCFNIFIYIRNLVHIWRERGKLTKALNIGAHAFAVALVAVATYFMVLTWLREYDATQEMTAEEAGRNWFWLGVWGVGQAMFFARFAIQWLVTELRKKSIVPPVFWYLSMVAGLLYAASFVQRHNWIFAAGTAATILIYARNIWFIQTAKQATAPATAPDAES